MGVLKKIIYRSGNQTTWQGKKKQSIQKKNELATCPDTENKRGNRRKKRLQGRGLVKWGGKEKLEKKKAQTSPRKSNMGKRGFDPGAAKEGREKKGASGRPYIPKKI